ncbi:MAG: hypothetical protein RLZZ579_344 [Actinomycetota bacterium]
MSLFVKVVPESDLIQIDREFDFRVPQSLQTKIQYGQRISFQLGRSKKKLTGFVVSVETTSNYATSEILEIVDEKPVLIPEIYEMARTIADRQVVALGEILSLAIPDHMPRTEVLDSAQLPSSPHEVIFPTPKFSAKFEKRNAILCSLRGERFGESIFPQWAVIAAMRAYQQLKNGKSSLIVVPEKSDASLVLALLDSVSLSEFAMDYSPTKKAERFRAFQMVLESKHRIVVGTRGAIYAPVGNLGEIIVCDDLDDSLSEEGSPFTHIRELAMIRAGSEIGLSFLANYRSVEIQRLVEIGYLNSVESLSVPIRFSFSEPGNRFDSASFNLLREQLENGPLLVLVPRKGHSLACFCDSCRERVRCKTCGGAVWQATAGRFECRICATVAVNCQNCNSSTFKLGRAGSERTVAELGKAFPNIPISEATAAKALPKLRSKQQIVVATPGTIPNGWNKFSGVLILDCEVWLSRESLRSEELALRDWTDALALLLPEGRALAAGLNGELGKVISLGQWVSWAKDNLNELRQLKLPPTYRVCTLEGSREVIDDLVSQLVQAGAETLRYSNEQELTQVLFRFSYSAGTQVSEILREVSVKTAPRATKQGNRRGLRIVMDDMRAL